MRRNLMTATAGDPVQEGRALKVFDQQGRGSFESQCTESSSAGVMIRLVNQLHWLMLSAFIGYLVLFHLWVVRLMLGANESGSTKPSEFAGEQSAERRIHVKLLARTTCPILSVSPDGSELTGFQEANAFLCR
jgi:hypothetical protein